MDTPSYGSPVWAYVNNQYSMRVSHDDDQSDPKDLSSLGVVDLGIAPEGFHDVVIENLAATPTWRSRRLLPGDVTSLRRR